MNSAPTYWPALPAPTPDETSFLEGIAALGEEWPQIMNEAIENRISNARLEASLPRFESFGFDNAQSTPSYDSNQAYNHQPYHLQQPRETYAAEPSFLPPPPPAPLPPASSFNPPPHPVHHLPSHGFPQFPTSLQPTYNTHPQHSVPSAHANGFQDGERRGNFDESRRNFEESTGRIDGVGRPQASGLTQSQEAPLQWWERGQGSLSRSYAAQSGGANLNYRNPPLQQPLQASSYSRPHYQPPSSQMQYQQEQYRPFPPPPQPSQLPYQPPSREWNQALPSSYPPWEQQQLEQSSLSSQPLRETSHSSNGSANLLPAGLTYAASPSPQLYDHSRQSSVNTYGNFESANEQLLSASIRNPPSGVGKRTRINSSNYSRPPLNPQDHLSGTPPISSQPIISSSSSSALASTSSTPLPPAPLNRSTSKVKAKATTTTLAIPTSNRKGNKTKIDVPVSCVSCGRSLARLILRGLKRELEVPFEASFTCLECDATAEGGGGGNEESPAGSNSLGERSPSGSPHAGTGGPSSSGVSNPSTSASAPSMPTTFRKKNKRLDAGQATLTACDVCLMDRAKGSVQPREPDKGHTIDFQIEVVCASCDEKYQRCSDCGGGGGVRLGTGKWRSKELFKDGKKTCSLRHQRLGAFPEMEYQVWKNTDLPREELDEVSEKCGELFANQMLGAIAIPEVLERNGAIWTSFAEAQSHAYSGWKGMDPMIRYDIEASQGIRRYLALRLCAPNLRKTMRKAELPVPSTTPRTGQIFKGEKEIVGYIIGEWDMNRGVLFLALVIPWDATGEAYDATTLLLQALCTRVQQDQRKENELRSARGDPLLPKLERVFTMIFFKTGSRMITQLTKKRGFAPIEDYLAANPKADPLAFPPHRPIYLPLERQRGWAILIRTLRENADGTPDDWSARRNADEGRGKKKEARARATREKEKAQDDFR
ncbi:uncharacterized protein JCM6883_006319 [Sporobolomyces salmoneus]|uniref:uncharacterized protein n=1 Tax=Sporobolomyces salmoneus TaxID=183962 RepID=UPI003174A043